MGPDPVQPQAVPREWWAAVPRDDWPEAHHASILEDFDTEGDEGDRRQELVFIGAGLDEQAITQALDACLLSEDETRAGLEYWRTLPDPFPDWGVMGPDPERTSPVSIHLAVEDADAMFAQAVAAGCTPEMPPMDQFWGDRYGLVKDRFGVHWGFGSTPR